MSVQTVARLCAPLLGLILVGQMIFAPASMARTLHIGNQSVTLTPDKRSTPALAVQLPEGIWYGFLTPGTAPGRLTVRMPDNQILSLRTAPDYTFSTIQADFPRIWTWDHAFRDANPRWGNQAVWWDLNWYNNANMPQLSAPLSGYPAIYPTYWVQATCSATTGSWATKGNPVLPNPANGNSAFASNQMQCWCRLKRRSDGANGGWIFHWTISSAALCAIDCPGNCANHAAVRSDIRSALLDAFANP